MKANKEEKLHNLFTTYMNLWNGYINTCNSMYFEYIRIAMKMNESWLNLLSKFWLGQYKDKVKPEQSV